MSRHFFPAISDGMHILIAPRLVSVRTYSTSIYLSKEHILHIAGEKTMLEEYSRAIEYPKTADMDKMRATLVDGLVTVHGECIR